MLEAVQALDDKHQADKKNYGDVDKLLCSNPLIAALFNVLAQAVFRLLKLELESRLPSPEVDLLTYEDVASRMNKSVGAVRQMKARGYIHAAKFTKNGKAYFTQEEVARAIREAEEREKETRTNRANRLVACSSAGA